MPQSDSVTSNDFVNIKSDQSYPVNLGNSANMSPTSMLSSASDVSTKLGTKAASTIESLKLWSVSAYKCTRQIVSERFGKSSRTIDPELEAMIEVIWKSYLKTKCLNSVNYKQTYSKFKEPTRNKEKVRANFGLFAQFSDSLF